MHDGPRSSTRPISRRLILRPGTPVMVREPGVVQVGLAEPRLRLRDEPSTRDLLRDLGQMAGVLPADVDAASQTVLGRLDAAGLLAAVYANDPARPNDLDVLRSQFGRDAQRRRTARVTARIAVHADDVDGESVAAALARAGLAAVEPTELNAEAHLVVARGTLDREVLDPLMRASIPHLIVIGSATGRRVGPFVDPGRTACQRCVDAHESSHDPRLPLLWCQAAQAAVEAPPPADPVLDEIAFAWAARDLCRYVEGDEPSTWSTTVNIDPLGPAEHLRWRRHPECGCAWDAIEML